MGENLVLGLFLILPFISGGLLWYFSQTLRKRKISARWPQLLAGNLLVLLFLLTFLPLAGEVYYRFIYDSTDSLDYTKVSQRWFQRYWRTNSNGLRTDVEYDTALPSGKRRITFVGDSFTAGHGIKHIRDRFINRIQQAHPEWEVHMIAMPGFDTGQELDGVKAFLGASYQIDMVVLVYCLNDISDLMPERQEALTRIVNEVKQSGWLRRNSYAVNVLYHRLNARREPFMAQYYSFVRNGYRGPLWEKQQERLRAFRDLIQSHNGRLAVVTFPFLHAVGPGYEYGAAHDALNRLWQEMKVPHLDLWPVYKDLSSSQITVNRFDAHPNEYASLLAAKAIDPFLNTLLTRKAIHDKHSK